MNVLVTRYNVRVDGKTARLTAVMDQAQALLRTYGVTTCADWLEEGSSRLRAGDGRAVRRVLSGYGGMGSFSDLVIHPMNGHPIEDSQVESVNARLSRLQQEIYQLAKELRGHWWW